jgi:hypothetical protein
MDTRNIAKEYRMTHWAGIMRERNESGKSIKSFCETEEIPQNVYYYWQRRLREAACQHILSDTHVHESPVRAVVASDLPVQAPTWSLCSVTESTDLPSPVSDGKADITIEIGKSRVKANTNTDLKLLGDVCRILMTLC